MSAVSICASVILSFLLHCLVKTNDFVFRNVFSPFEKLNSVAIVLLTASGQWTYAVCHWIFFQLFWCSHSAQSCRRLCWHRTDHIGTKQCFSLAKVLEKNNERIITLHWTGQMTCTSIVSSLFNEPNKMWEGWRHPTRLNFSLLPFVLANL